MEREHSILSVGDLRWDYLTQGRYLGGAAAAFACRMIALGHRVDIAAAVGDDPLGEEAIGEISQRGIDTGLVQRAEHFRTSEARIEINLSGIPQYSSLCHDAAGQLAELPTLIHRADEFDVLYFNSYAQSCTVTGATLQSLLSASPPSFKVYEICGGISEIVTQHLEAAFQVASVVILPQGDVAGVCAALGLPELEPALLSATVPERYGVSYCIVADPYKGSVVSSIVGEQILVSSHLPAAVDLLGWHQAYAAGFVHHVLKGSTLERCSTAGMQYGDLIAGLRGACGSLVKDQLEIVDWA